MITKEIMHKIRKTGDSISDKELDEAIEFLNKFKDMLNIMGDDYNLAHIDVVHLLNRLDSYKFARNCK